MQRRTLLHSFLWHCLNTYRRANYTRSLIISQLRTSSLKTIHWFIFLKIIILVCKSLLKIIISVCKSPETTRSFNWLFGPNKDVRSTPLQQTGRCVLCWVHLCVRGGQTKAHAQQDVKPTCRFNTTRCKHSVLLQPANSVFLSHQTSTSQLAVFFSHNKSASTTSHSQPNRVKMQVPVISCRARMQKFGCRCHKCFKAA